MPVYTDKYFFHPDHLGSSSYITNLAGVVSQHMEYLPFGELLIDEHLNSHNSPFKFNAKELDPETGNYYYGARYYDPKWSIWLSVDPLAEAMPSWSSYAYTFNNPVRFTDPTGMIPESPNTDIFKVFKNEDGTYRAEKWKHINDGKNDQMYLVMNDDGVATSMYQGVEAQHDMYKDGIKLDGVDYKNGSTLDIVVKATSDFLTSDDYRTKNARETMKNYVTAAGLVITGPAALSEAGLIGMGARFSVIGAGDDLSANILSNGQTVIQNSLGETNGNMVKTGLNVFGVIGATTSVIKNGVNTIDLISGSLDAGSIIERNIKEK